MKIDTEITKKVKIENLTSWTLYFKRLTEPGDVVLEPKSKFPDYLPFEEVQAQIRARNTMFTGINGRGDHARIKVDDEARKLLFDMEDGEKVELLTLEAVKELLAISQLDKFTKRLNELVVMDFEKRMISTLAEEAGINETAAWKLRAIAAIAQDAEESYAFAPMC